MPEISDWVNALRGETVPLPPVKRVDPASMYRYIHNTPHLNEQYTPWANIDQMVSGPMADARVRQILPEAAAVADPFGVSYIQRALGYNPPTQVRINEGHGLAHQQNRRFEGW